LRIIPKIDKVLRPGDEVLYTENTNIESTVIDCQALREKSIYVSAKGDVYPCCYLGDQPMATYPKTDVDYRDLSLLNKMPLKPACEVCTNMCKSVDGRNLT